MSFDKKWQTEIYSAKRQLNKYPFDSLVSIVHYLFKKKIKNNISALDLGCGAGNNTKFLIDFGFKNITAIDGSATAIKFAKKRIKQKNCKFLIGDYIKMNLSKKKYDLIVDRLSLSHNTKKKISYMINNNLKIKKNGYFISYLFSKKHSEFKTKKFFKNAMKLKSPITASFYNKYEILKLFKNFKIIKFYHNVTRELKSNHINSHWIVVAKNK